MVVAARELLRQPWDIAVLPTGEVMVWSWTPDGFYLDAYDANLAILWTRDLGHRSAGMSVDGNGLVWALDNAGASAYSDEGELKTRIEAPSIPGMEVSALELVDGDFVFAYRHVEGSLPDNPALVRVTPSGAVLWSTRLTTETITFTGDPYAREVAGRFSVSTWKCGFRAGTLCRSGDMLLAVYADMPRSGIGVGYALSLTTGALSYVTKYGPINNVAAGSAGSFLVGYMGYGIFETISYSRAGNEQNKWASQGYYVLEGDDVRVIELDNRRSLPRLARLKSDGTVVTGDLLEGYYTSEPYLRSDGMLFFAREGLLNAVADLRIDYRTSLKPPAVDGAFFHTRIVSGRNGAFATYSANRIPPKGSGPIGHVSGLVRLAI